MAVMAGGSALPCGAQDALYVEPEDMPPVVTGPYKVNVGDELTIDFFKTTDLNQERVVGPDGEVFLTLIGRVKVLGRTVEDVTQELNRRYAEEMVNPQITVSVSNYTGLTVYVSGEVLQPGEVPYRGGLSLVQAVFNAGGFTKRARWKEVLLIRRREGQPPVGTLVNVKEILRDGQLANDVALAPLDVVYVHHSKIVGLNIFVEQVISRNIPQVGPWLYYFGDY
jgi:protein involved in polysaccharide export with SLBB domain